MGFSCNTVGSLQALSFDDVSSVRVRKVVIIVTKCKLSLEWGHKARTNGCVRNDSETHETVLLECMTGEAGSAIQLHQPSVFYCHSAHTVRSRFYNIHIVYKRNWDDSCLMNLTQTSYS